VGIDASIERTAQRFLATVHHKSTYHYVRSKLRYDPATRAVADLAPLGDVIDLGCGRGHLAVYLLESGAARSVRGFDWDARKIALAQRASEGLDASFVTLDARHVEAKPADTVLLIDVLHYLDPAAQEALFRHATSLLRPGGRLIVRDVTRGRGWRSLVTLFVEWISMLVRFNVGERIAIRDVEKEYVPLLEARDLVCTVTPCFGGTPFANVLLVAERPKALPRGIDADAAAQHP
jgi:2-polyprenyl-3-methyl-5-hydroxy-6-metoxy-1,4-benzoquinol methylase